MAILASGDFLGEECITTDQPARVTIATAIAHCSVLKIARQEMLRTLHIEHAFSRATTLTTKQREGMVNKGDFMERTSVPND